MPRRIVRSAVALLIVATAVASPTRVQALPGIGGRGGSGGQVDGTLSAYVWISTSGGGGGSGCDWELVTGTLAVGDNGSATWGWPGGIERRFAVEGWATAVVDGRDRDALEAALGATDPARPGVVVALREPRP